MRFASLFLRFLFLLTLLASAISAQVQRSFVSAQHGSDGNASTNCGPTAPCRTFTTAVGVTSPGGEVIVLDSGGYGPFTISQSVKIEAPPGVYAGITAFAGDAITVSAGASDSVVLKGLTINGLGGGNGIIASSIGMLAAEDCLIDGFNAEAIFFNPSTSATLLVKNTVMRNSHFGVAVGGSSPAAVVKALIDHCTLFGIVNNAISSGSNSQVTARDTVIGSSGLGFQAFSGAAGASALLNVENCSVTNGGIGIFAQTNSNTSTVTVRVSQTLIADNTTGIETHNFGGTLNVLSLGNNRLLGNGTDGSFTSTPGLK
jgi:hypothetical protein